MPSQPDGIVTKVKTAKQQYDQAVASKDPTQINLASATLVHEALDQIGAITGTFTGDNAQQLAAYAQDLSDLQTALLGKPEYMAWRAKAMAALQTASTETVEKVFYEQLEAQTPAVPTSPGACASMVSLG